MEPVTSPNSPSSDPGGADGGPLAGVRVLDATGDLGRFATKLLAEYGADVARVDLGGASGNRLADETDLGVLDWWFDHAKTPIAIDMSTSGGQDQYRQLACAADVVVESFPVDFLAQHNIDHEHLVAANPTLTQISLTPFGRTGPRRHWQSSDLVAGALGGVLSLTGLSDQPLNSWGWQNYNSAGFAAGICALAGLRSAQRSGQGQLVDLSLNEVVASSIENLLMQLVYDEELEGMPRLAPRQGSLHWLRAYKVVPAGEGALMITPTPSAENLTTWMLESGIERAKPFDGMEPPEVIGVIDDFMEVVTEFVSTRPASELFHEAQRRHVAFGEVQTVEQLGDNPQLEHRSFFADAPLPSGQSFPAPWRLVRFTDTPIVAPTTPELRSQPTDAAAITQRWQSAAASPSTDVQPTAAKPLDGLRIVDLSWVLAGPFATRLLGDLGADVIKVQTEERATLVNQPEYPYYPSWNRSKRSVTLNLKHPDGPAALRRLVVNADVVIENYAAGVLDRLGVGWDQVKDWNDQIVYISMSGCGHDGPWANIISYAPTIHALCGLTYLTNPADRLDIGCGYSLNDHAAGFGAAFSVLAGLQARNRTGRGQYIDMAQFEVGAYLVGPALVDWAANGRAATPDGNADPLAGVVPNEVFACGDGDFLAITAADDAMWARLADIIGLDIPLDSADTDRWRTLAGRQADRVVVNQRLSQWCAGQEATAAMERLQAAGVAAGVVQNAETVMADQQNQAREFFVEAESDIFGVRPHDRFPAQWSQSGTLEPYRPAPNYLGEANFEVWTEVAGFDFEEVAEGIADGLFI